MLFRSVWIRLAVPATPWSESTVTWNNAPQPDDNAPTVNANLGSGTNDVLDVTTLVQYAVNHGYTNVDLIIGFVDAGDHSQEWYSHESGKGPVLDIDP